MPLKLMYITNHPDIALIAQKYGVDRIWIDLETLGKEKRQQNMDSVKSHHTVWDIYKLAPLMKKSEVLVRINPMNDGSVDEIETVIEAGADIIMLPMWKSVSEVKRFVEIVNHRVKTILLLETKEAVSCLDFILELGGYNEIHIGLNDLHISYGLSFMFELLANGVVEKLCKKISAKNIPYGFGGCARLGEGALPAEQIIMEHYRLGSSMIILSRSFCRIEAFPNLDEIDTLFRENINEMREFENKLKSKSQEEFEKNRELVIQNVRRIVGCN